jgi:hypothetical protein
VYHRTTFIRRSAVSEAYKIKEVLKDSNNLNGAFKFINTGTIDQYLSLWGNRKTQYIKDQYKYPTINNEDLSNISNKRLQQTKLPKIIIAGMSLIIEAFFDENGEYLAGKSTTIIIGEYVNLIFLCGILNSKLISFYITNQYYSLKMAGGYLSINTDIINSIPLPSILQNNNKPFEILVNKIISKKEAGEDTTAEERKIDLMVYKLYELTYEEVKIIESEFDLTKKEYENYE